MSIFEDYKKPEYNNIYPKGFILLYNFLLDFFTTLKNCDNTILSLGNLDVDKNLFDLDVISDKFKKLSWHQAGIEIVDDDLKNKSRKLYDELSGIKEVITPNLLSVYLYFKYLDITKIADKKNELFNFIDVNSEELKSKVSDSNKSLESLLNKINEGNNEADNLIKSAIDNVKKFEEEGRRLLKGKISETYMREFDIKSLKFEKISKRWRYLMYLSLFVLAGVILYFLFIELSNNQPVKEIHYSIIIYRISFLSVLTWLTLFFSKNYNNNKNLSYIYEQKHVMISTYLAFIDTISDPTVKDNLAGEIGKIIFDVVETGFIKNPHEPAPNLPSIISNIFKQSKQ